MSSLNLKGTAILSAAIVFCGLMLPVAINRFRSFDRVVTVKGLCEEEVKADKAIWPITYKATSNDLTDLTSKIDKGQKIIVDFLKAGGIDESEISFSAPLISDKFAQEYGSNDRAFRFISRNTITVCTDKVDKVQELSCRIYELMKKGVLIGNENRWESAIEYHFEGLNDIKPDMIQKATANARVAAEQFAKDSGSKIGKIKTASQGTFSIEPRDSNTPQIKRIRVVTSITYTLKN